MEGYSTSREVADRLGIDGVSLRAYLAKHPEYKPNTKFGNAFLWSEQDIERLWQFRMRPISRGPNTIKQENDK